MHAAGAVYRLHDGYRYRRTPAARYSYVSRQHKCTKRSGARASPYIYIYIYIYTHTDQRVARGRSRRALPAPAHAPARRALGVLPVTADAESPARLLGAWAVTRRTSPSYSGPPYRSCNKKNDIAMQSLIVEVRVVRFFHDDSDSIRGSRTRS
jgi:hypothetical protein